MLQRACLNLGRKNEVYSCVGACLGSWMKERGIFMSRCLFGLMDERTR